MTTLADLPDDRYVLAALEDGTLAAVPHDDPLAPLARRWLNNKRTEGDEAAIRAWLVTHPQFEITRLPAPSLVPLEPLPEPARQLAFWEAA